MFYHNPINGNEWYVVDQMPNGMYRAVCTRGTNIYPLGTVQYFSFDIQEGIWHLGTWQPQGHSLSPNGDVAHQRSNANRDIFE